MESQTLKNTKNTEWRKAEIVTLILAVVIGCATIWIAYSQYNLEQNRAKADLFNLRMIFYRNTVQTFHQFHVAATQLESHKFFSQRLNQVNGEDSSLIDDNFFVNELPLLAAYYGREVDTANLDDQLINYSDFLLEAKFLFSDNKVLDFTSKLQKCGSVVLIYSLDKDFSYDSFYDCYIWFRDNYEEDLIYKLFEPYLQINI
jgi:hypothetical protein